MTWVGLREMRQCRIVAGGSGDSVLTREESTHAKSGGQPSHNFYATLRHSTGESMCHVVSACADREEGAD